MGQQLAHTPGQAGWGRSVEVGCLEWRAGHWGLVALAWDVLSARTAPQMRGPGSPPKPRGHHGPAEGLAAGIRGQKGVLGVATGLSSPDLALCTTGGNSRGQTTKTGLDRVRGRAVELVSLPASNRARRKCFCTRPWLPSPPFKGCPRASQVRPRPAELRE